MMSSVHHLLTLNWVSRLISKQVSHSFLIIKVWRYGFINKIQDTFTLFGAVSVGTNMDISRIFPEFSLLHVLKGIDTFSKYHWHYFLHFMFHNFDVASCSDCYHFLYISYDCCVYEFGDQLHLHFCLQLLQNSIINWAKYIYIFF